MRYPIAIEPGDDKHAFGVVVPDLPGCFSAGDSLDDALAQARDAILSGHLLAFCVTSNLLSPDKTAQGAMMSMANERVAEVLKSGWLDRNVVRVV